jgi:ABC-2 type transport system ATP-binding protein
LTVIELQGIGKRYWQVKDRAMLLRSLLPFSGATKTEHWALKDVDLTVRRGETLGILGRNGAGKTTLLRLLAGVSRPTEGEAHLNGRVAPLLSVGVGFHQEMSGRENIYVNGMLLGLTRAEVREQFDAIVAFAELEEHIDTPVKFYSSGMFMRLGFAVAVHVDPDIMLIDEVLAVGDLAFQLKCFDRLRALQRAGTTILMVSHSMHAIRLLCPRTVLLSGGRVHFDGETETAIALHHELLSVATADPSQDVEVRVILSERRLSGSSGPERHPRLGDRVVFAARLDFIATVEDPQLVFQVLSEEGTLVYSMLTTVGRDWRVFDEGEAATVEVPFVVRLGGGTYRLRLIVCDRDARHVVGPDSQGFLIYISPALGMSGAVDLEAQVAVEGTILTDHRPVMLGDDEPPPTGAPVAANG